MRHSRQDRIKGYLQSIERDDEGLEAAADEAGGLLDRIHHAPVEGVRDEEIENAQSAVRKLARDEDLRPEELWALEAIVLPTERPVVDIVDGSFGAVEAPFAHLASADPRARIERVIPSIGRIAVPERTDLPFAGTGFVVADGLLMTNRHVASLFTQGVGRRELSFLPGQSAEIDFRQEIGGGEPEHFEITRVLMVHPFWDMALLGVEGLSARPLDLLAVDPAELAGREVVVIGYPAFDQRNDAELQMRIFRRAFNVKRLQPGKLRQRANVVSFGNLVSAVTHDSSTLGGNSGSAVVDVETGKVVALHFAGRYLEANFAVPISELARDRRLHQAGLPLDGELAEPTVPWDSAWLQLESRGETSASASAEPQPALAAPAAALVGDHTFALSIPLEVTVRLGTAQQPAAGTPVFEGLERLVEPFHDESYDHRPGYQERFLGLRVPPPRLLDPAVASKLDDGTYLVPYEHFSLAVDKRRRLALFTAANVDGTSTHRRPDPSKRYSRAALSGLGKNDREKWFVDPRLPAIHQLPDRFFTKDRGSFDKGHLVRREAVAWGRSYDELRRANGDTYHVTNCSPQVGAFNRSNLGGLWGQLENLVLAQSEDLDEKYCIFAGPVLDDDDPVFQGVDDVGQVRIQIPRHYWKVVVARHGSHLASFAFLLEQELGGVELEFAVEAPWRARMLPVADLERRLRLVELPEEVRRADRFEAVEGPKVRAAVERVSAIE